jgi:hypothetical protein
MSNPQTPETEHHEATREEMMSGLFAYLVMQQSNMAMMLMGKVPHPESGKAVKDLDSAKLFIDQLEMLEVKTKGNLSKEEAGMLKQSLMNLRLAFVESVEAPGSRRSDSPPASSTGPAEPTTAEGTTQAAPDAATAAPAEDEHRKKFTKKY